MNPKGNVYLLGEIIMEYFKNLKIPQLLLILLPALSLLLNYLIVLIVWIVQTFQQRGIGIWGHQGRAATAWHFDYWNIHCICQFTYFILYISIYIFHIAYFNLNISYCIFQYRQLLVLGNCLCALHKEGD